MAYKNILAYCNNSQLASRLFEVSVALAKKNGAHLTGLYLVPQPHLHASVGEEFIGELIENQESFFKEQGELIEAAFDKARAGQEIKSHWSNTHSNSAFVSRAVVEHTHYADLAIINQAEAEHDVAQENGIPAELILEGGRPVLIVPKSGDLGEFGHDVLVAWNGSREAARAVYDALPFLTHARKVEVFELSDEDRRGEHLSAADLVNSLKHHGVKASDASEPLDNYDVGAYFLDRAEKQNFDMLVMGGYGHSRLTEFVLGGATRHVLMEATIPVLMSH